MFHNNTQSVQKRMQNGWQLSRRDLQRKEREGMNELQKFISSPVSLCLFPYVSPSLSPPLLPYRIPCHRHSPLPPPPSSPLSSPPLWSLPLLLLPQRPEQRQRRQLHRCQHCRSESQYLCLWRRHSSLLPITNPFYLDLNTLSFNTPTLFYLLRPILTLSFPSI